MKLIFRPITEDDAREVLGWRYDAPYDVYNAPAEELEDNVRWFLLPENAYYAILNEEGELLAFCCYGPDARVPGGDYNEDAVDVGIGLRPDRTGQGLGTGLLEAVLDFGREARGITAYRTTIAAWNRRSIRTFERAGFRVTGTFRNANNPAGSDWVQLALEGSGDSSPG